MPSFCYEHKGFVNKKIVLFSDKERSLIDRSNSVTSHSDIEESGQNINNSNTYNSINGHPDAGDSTGNIDKKDGQILQDMSGNDVLL